MKTLLGLTSALLFSSSAGYAQPLPIIGTYCDNGEAGGVISRAGFNTEDSLCTADDDSVAPIFVMNCVHPDDPDMMESYSISVSEDVTAGLLTVIDPTGQGKPFTLRRCD